MAGKTKVSEIDATYLASYLRIESPTTAQTDELETMLASAIGYMESYTGLPKVAPTDDVETTDVDESDVDHLDNHAEFMIAVCVLVQNQYDNRSFYKDKGQVEAVVQSILGLHRNNLIV